MKLICWSEACEMVGNIAAQQQLLHLPVGVGQGPPLIRPLLMVRAIVWRGYICMHRHTPLIQKTDAHTHSNANTFQVPELASLPGGLEVPC